MEMRILNKENIYIFKKYINLSPTLTNIILVLNVIISVTILPFNQFIKHAYINIYIIFLIFWNLYYLRIKNFDLKIKKIEQLFIFLGLFLILNIIDSVNIFPEIASIYFIPYLIGFNIFYDNKKTLQLTSVILLLLVFFYFIDYTFLKQLWKDRKFYEPYITTYFIINVFVCLLLSVFYTYVNVYTRFYKIPIKSNKENVLNEYPNDLYEKLIFHLEHTKAYLNEDYSLKSLAKDLKSNVTYVSKAINSIDDQNFYHLINHYRIEELKKEINNNLKSGNKNYTLEYYFTKYGFKSQSTFNKAFKKNTGITPTEYINQSKTEKNQF